MPYKSNCAKEMKKERNITKRVQEFKKTFDFVNSYLLKGVATMAELTNNRQPMGKIKPTDKMVMMLSLFCKAQPRRASLGYPFHNTAAHTEATPTREGI